MTEQKILVGRWLPPGMLASLQEWYSAQLSGQHSRDQCGIDQNDQRRHLATERLLQECRKMWGDCDV